MALSQVRDTKVWKGSFTVPRATRPGRWTATIKAVDGAGNRADYDTTTWHPRLSVDSREPDLAAPTITELRLSTLTIDTRRAPAAVEVSLSARDNVGVAWAGLELSEVDEAGDGRRDYRARLAPSEDGTFSGTLHIPMWQGTDTFKIYASVSDGINISSDLPEDSPTTVSVVSGQDRTRPALTSLRLGTHRIDARLRARDVSVTAHAKDVGAGVREVLVGLSPPLSKDEERQAVIHDPPIFISTLKRTSGTPNSGAWAGTIHVPRCARVGTYRVYVSVPDAVSPTNLRWYQGRRLTEFGTPSTVRVISRATDTYLPTATVRRLSPRRLFVAFSEGVINVTRRNIRVLDYRPRRHSADMRTHCRNRNRVAVPCNGGSGLVRSVILTTAPGEQLSHSWRVFPNIWGVAPQVTDRAGNPVYKETQPAR